MPICNLELKLVESFHEVQLGKNRFSVDHIDEVLDRLRRKTRTPNCLVLRPRVACEPNRLRRHWVETHAIDKWSLRDTLAVLDLVLCTITRLAIPRRWSHRRIHRLIDALLDLLPQLTLHHVSEMKRNWSLTLSNWLDQLVDVEQNLDATSAAELAAEQCMKLCQHVLLVELLVFLVWHVLVRALGARVAAGADLAEHLNYGWNKSNLKLRLKFCHVLIE